MDEDNTPYKSRIQYRRRQLWPKRQRFFAKSISCLVPMHRVKGCPSSRHHGQYDYVCQQRRSEAL